jgi:hypothetical protein
MRFNQETSMGFPRITKYAPFIWYLDKQGDGPHRVTFSLIEKVLKFELPPSSRYPQWWSNNDVNSVFTKAWLKAGWRSKDVDVDAGKITFYRPTELEDAELAVLDLDRLNPVARGVLSVLAKRSGRSPADEALIILNDHLAP